MRPAILTFAATGADTAARLAALTGGTIHACGPAGEDAKTLLPRLFRTDTPIIGICAAGILIRLLAPLLDDKHAEPPVLAVSPDGAHIVPLLGGHHGANRLARELADGLGGVAALTTASDARFTRGLDEPPPGWRLENPDAVKPAMAALLAGRASIRAVAVTLRRGSPRPVTRSRRSTGTVAVRFIAGERRDARAGGAGVTSPANPRRRRRRRARRHRRDRNHRPDHRNPGARRPFAAEPCSLRLPPSTSRPMKPLAARIGRRTIRLGVPLPACSPSPNSTPSARPCQSVRRRRGRNRHPRRRRGRGAQGRLANVAGARRLEIGPRHPRHRAARPPPLDPMADLAVRPGAAASRRHRSRRPAVAHCRIVVQAAALPRRRDWVGYGLYLDLIADLRRDQAEHRFGLGDEEPRVRHALELAATGRAVALVCSGDAQIYAMATLAFELLDPAGPPRPVGHARRAASPITSHPGISAFQAASAAAGALLGHDFCCISLSDLLTPQRRHPQSAARPPRRGDFVVAFYNPRSGRRTELLGEAVRIFRDHRPSQTPVIVARNLGRADETVSAWRPWLDTFDPETVDMLTIVLKSAAQHLARRSRAAMAARSPTHHVATCEKRRRRNEGGRCQRQPWPRQMPRPPRPDCCAIRTAPPARGEGAKGHKPSPYHAPPPLAGEGGPAAPGEGLLALHRERRSAHDRLLLSAPAPARPISHHRTRPEADRALSGLSLRRIIGPRRNRRRRARRGAGARHGTDAPRRDHRRDRGSGGTGRGRCPRPFGRSSRSTARVAGARLRRLDGLGIPYEVVPGVPAFAGAAARLASELTLPEISQTIILTRTSGKASPMPESERLRDIGPEQGDPRDPPVDPQSRLCRDGADAALRRRLPR